MRQSFDKYLEHVQVTDEDPSPHRGNLNWLDSKKKQSIKQAKDFLADALFAYQMIVEICKKEIDELFEDGVKYFNLFLTFIFDVYEEFEKKYDYLLSMSDQGQSRYAELRTFMKTEIFDDFLIVYITRVGTPGVIQVIRTHQDNPIAPDEHFYQRLQRLDGSLGPGQRQDAEHHW